MAQMSEVHEMFCKLSAMKYSDQAIWFLNMLTPEEFEHREMVFKAFQKFVELDKESDKKKGDDGNELDVFWAARFLETFDKALTAIARKEALRTMDVDANGNMSLIEYLTWKFKKQLKHVAEAPQGDNQDQLEKAQKKMAEVQRALDEVIGALNQLKAEKAKLDQLKAELEAAIAELNAQEAAYKKKCDDLQNKIDNPATSGMQRAKASNELAQLKSEDPLPLRRAKITQEAALRKVAKQEKQVAAAIADNEAKQAQLQVAMEEAREELERVKKAGGNGGKGALWFSYRQLYEADAFLPTNKQQYDHKKTFDEQYTE